MKGPGNDIQRAGGKPVKQIDLRELQKPNYPNEQQRQDGSTKQAEFLSSENARLKRMQRFNQELETENTNTAQQN